MTKILMPINPIHVEKILSGVKKYEYRKIIPKRLDINKMYIYSTSPVKKVVAEVEVLDILINDKHIIWNLTRHYSGTDKIFFDKYYKNKNISVAYKLGKITLYNPYKELKEYNINYYPQSYIYLD